MNFLTCIMFGGFYESSFAFEVIPVPQFDKHMVFSVVLWRKYGSSQLSKFPSQQLERFYFKL